MRSVPLIIHEDKLEVSDYWSKVIRQAVKDAGRPIRGEIIPYTAESSKLRRYVFGCLIKLLIYLDNNDYRDPKVNDWYFEHYKKEFSPEVININGKIQMFGKSTKGAKALNTFAEKLQDYLHEEYAIYRDNRALQPEEYKRFVDEIYSFSNEYEDYIDYCVKIGWINKSKMI